MENIFEPTYTVTESSPTFVAGGPVQAANGVYLERSADRQLLELCRSRTFAYVLTSRQMGKSSLMVRTARQLLLEGVRSVILDLTGLGSLLSADQWYTGIIEAVADQLDIRAVHEWCTLQNEVGLSQLFIRFFRDIVLPTIPGPIVIFVDEIDSTLALQFSDDFFAAIRYLYHSRTNDPNLSRLSFVLIGVASPDDLIKDARRTPFNIGQRVDLSDFTIEEARPLVAGLNLSPIEATLFLDWVLRWTGGHPYLTLCVFRKFQQDSLPWVTDDVVIQGLFLGGHESPDSNIEFVRKMLVRDHPIRKGVLSTFESICYGQRISDGSGAVKSCLKLSGLVTPRQGVLEIRNAIYTTVFDLDWLKAVRKELKRQSEQSGSTQIPMQRIVDPETSDNKQGDLKAPRPSTLPLAVSSIERSILLAVESMWQSSNLAANQFLYESLPLLRKQRLSIVHHQKVTSVAFSPDGRYAASASEDHTVQVFEINTGFEVASVRHQDRICDLAFTPDGRFFATASWDGCARIWSVRGGRLLAEAPHEDCVTAVLFSEGGRLLITASWDQTARIWNVTNVLKDTRSTSSQLLVEDEILTHEDRVSALAMDAGGRVLVTASWDNTARLWATNTGKEICKFSHKNRVADVAITSDGMTVATASEDHTAGIWSTRTQQQLAVLTHGSRVNHVAINEATLRLATCSDDRTARTWDLLSGEELTRIDHLGRVSDVAFSVDGLLITASEDGSARIHSRPGRELARLSHGGRVTRVAFSANGAMAMSAADDGTARVWEQCSPVEMSCFLHSDQIRAVAFSPNGGLLASASEDGTASVWDCSGRGELLKVSHESRVTAVAFSWDNKKLLTASEDALACVWSTEDGQLCAKLSHPSWVYCAVFDRNNTRIITGCEDGFIRIWSAHTAKLVLALPHEARVWAVALDEAGNRFVSAGASRYASLWGIEEDKPLHRFDCGEEVYSLAICGVGSILATGNASGIIRVWQVNSGQLMYSLQGEAGVYGLDFTSDGKFLIAGYGDGTVRVWDVTKAQEVIRLRESSRVHSVAFQPDGRLIAIATGHRVRLSLWVHNDVVAFARSHLTRNLTRQEWEEYFEGELYRKTCPDLP